jgi:hypothetical protein
MGVFNFDVTNANFVTKERYSEEKVEELVLTCPTVALMPKRPDYGGTSYIGTAMYAPMASISVSDAVAFTTGTPSQFATFNCPWNSLFGSANLTGYAIDACKGDENALVDVIYQQVDAAYLAIGIGLGQAVWGSGGGSIAQLSGGTVSGTGPFTLTIPSQITNMYAGMILNSSATNGSSGAVRTGSVTIQAVDVNAGTFTTTAAANSGIAAIVNTDYLFPQGAFGAFLTFPIPNWIPTSANRPTISDNFNGVNRFTTDPARLAGVYYAGGGADKAESLLQTLILVNRLQGKPTHVMANNLDFSDILKGLTGRVEYSQDTAFENPQIGFDAVKVVTPAGTVQVMQDPFVPQGSCWSLELNNWVMPSMGQVPKVGDIDGQMWLRQNGIDAYSMRLVSRFTDFCSAPAHNGATTF